ncbi:MAG: phosphoribosylglycinamide formyltransferase [Flavobacteriia bacterium]|jgi:phosphoribosylglycinamide formyltransferase-1
MNKARLAIFASGTGSNAINIMNYFQEHPTVEVACILSNRANAPVLEKAKIRLIETIILSNEEAENASVLLELTAKLEIDYVILAGYLRLIPAEFILKFNRKIFNIHPSLLPKYGGKGMFGDHVHRAVLESGEKETGITIHYVDPAFDEGEIIDQFKCVLAENETLESVRLKINALELTHFPSVIEKTILKTE